MTLYSSSEHWHNNNVSLMILNFDLDVKVITHKVFYNFVVRVTVS